MSRYESHCYFSQIEFNDVQQLVFLKLGVVSINIKYKIVCVTTCTYFLQKNPEIIESEVYIL